VTLTEEIEEARERAQELEDRAHEKGKQLAALAMVADALDRLGLEGHTLTLSAKDGPCITLRGTERDAVIMALRAHVFDDFEQITSQGAY